MSSQWWRYLVSVLIGILVFVSVILSCTATSSSKESTLLGENVKEQKLIVPETKSLEAILANLPTAEEIRGMHLASHPRLLASERRFAEIKNQVKTDATMKKWYQELHQQGEKFLEDELPAYKKLDGKRLFEQNKGLLRRISTLTLLYKLDKNPTYINRVWQELKITADFPDWNSDHFLDTARITYIFAISYDWLYEDWSEEQRQIIRLAILQKGLEPALVDYLQNKWWVNAKQNWSQVCNGGIGIGALAVIEEYPEMASKILHSALKGISSAMEHYAPDGAWDEGTSYWNFGTRYNTLLLAALDTALDTDFNLSNIPGFSDTGLFPIYMTGSSKLPFNFSDGKDSPIKAPQLFWLSNRFGKKEYADYQRQVASPEPLDLIWYNPTQQPINTQKLPLDKYFRGAEIVSMRSEWNNPESVFVGFKAGNNNSNHGDLDLGTFVIDALGVRWAVELGYDDYNLPGYFDKKKQRWTYYQTRAEGQNTLVINPSRSPGQNRHAQAKITHFNSELNRVYATSNLTLAYYNVRKINRGISLQNERQKILIQDEIQTNTPIDLWWFMHTEADIEIDKDGKTAMLYQDGQRLWVKLLNPKPNYRFTVMNAEPLPSSPNPKGQAKNSGIKKLTVRLQDIESERLTVLLVPLRKKENLPVKMPEVKSLSKW